MTLLTSVSMIIRFISFDEQPVAAASIAQVHHALLKDNQEVAVKVCQWNYACLNRVFYYSIWGYSTIDMNILVH